MKEEPKNEYDLTTSLILDSIVKTQTAISGAKGIDTDSFTNVIVCGDTGAGKSTLINFLIGTKMAATAMKFTKLYSISAEQATPTEIGHTKSSKTMVPIQVIDTEHKTVFWDCPGFNDSRGSTAQIANAYSFHQLLSRSNVKILLLLEESALMGTDRTSGVKQIITRLSKMFADPEQFAQSLCVIFTKIKAAEDPKEMLRQNFLDTDVFSEQESILLNAILEHSAFSSFKAPLSAGEIDAAQKEAIFEQLESIKPASKLELKLVLEEEAELSIEDLRITVIEKTDVLAQKAIKEFAKEILPKCDFAALEQLINILQDNTDSKDAEPLIKALNKFSQQFKAAASPAVQMHKLLEHQETFTKFFKNFADDITVNPKHVNLLAMYVANLALDKINILKNNALLAKEAELNEQIDALAAKFAALKEHCKVMYTQLAEDDQKLSMFEASLVNNHSVTGINNIALLAQLQQAQAARCSKVDELQEFADQALPEKTDLSTAATASSERASTLRDKLVEGIYSSTATEVEITYPPEAASETPEIKDDSELLGSDS